MKISRYKIIFINILISLIILILFLLLGKTLFTSLSDFLVSIHRPTMLLVHSFDFYLIAFLPFWTYPLYFKKKFITLKKYILINILSLSILIITCIISFLLAAKYSKSPSPLIPNYFVELPFYYFSTFVIIISIFFANISYILIDKFKPKTTHSITEKK